MTPTTVLAGLVVVLAAAVAWSWWRLAELRRELHRDEDERATVERRLLQRDASLAHLVDELPVILWATDEALVVTATRGRGFGATGVDPERLVGAPLVRILDVDTVAADDRAAALAVHREALAGEASSLPVRVGGRSFEVRVVPLRNGTGGVVGTLGVALDVTDRAEVEEALAATVERERQLVDQLRAVDEMKTGFVQAVSHELRTPLTVLRGFAVTLRRGAGVLTDDQRATLLDRIAVNAERLHALLTDILDVDRLARGVVTLRRQRTDLGELVLRVLDETDLGDRPLRTYVTTAEAYVDGAKIERIVENLVGNARKHTPSGTPLTVEVARDEGGVTLSVGQAGVPVPDDLKASIFQPFRQGPVRQEHSPGTGVGLTLVARFAELHGGSAWVEDGADGGAVFRVYLPDHPDIDDVVLDLAGETPSLPPAG